MLVRIQLSPAFLLDNDKDSGIIREEKDDVACVDKGVKLRLTNPDKTKLHCFFKGAPSQHLSE
jgi:hypothetical protein